MLSSTPNSIGLREFIESIRSELLVESIGDEPLFVISSVEVEIEFAVVRNATGGVDFKVLQAGVDKTVQSVQKIKMKLDPILTTIEMQEAFTDEEKSTARKKLTRD